MLSANEESLLNRLTSGLFSIFRTAADFLPTDEIQSLGTYLRELATQPTEALAIDTAIVGAEIKATASINRVADPGTFDTIALPAPAEFATRLKQSGRKWTLVCEGIVSWTAADNVAVMGTCPAGTSVTFTYYPSTDKWYPSKVA